MLEKILASKFRFGSLVSFLREPAPPKFSERSRFGVYLGSDRETGQPIMGAYKGNAFKQYRTSDFKVFPYLVSNIAVFEDDFHHVEKNILFLVMEINQRDDRKARYKVGLSLMEKLNAFLHEIYISKAF